MKTIDEYELSPDCKMALEIIEEALIINRYIGSSATGKYVQHMGGEAREKAIIKILTEIKITKMLKVQK